MAASIAGRLKTWAQAWADPPENAVGRWKAIEELIAECQDIHHADATADVLAIVREHVGAHLQRLRLGVDLTDIVASAVGPSLAVVGTVELAFLTYQETLSDGSDVVAAAGVRSLPRGAQPAQVEGTLRALRHLMSKDAVDPLRRAVIRQETIRELERVGVKGPAELVNAALPTPTPAREPTAGQGRVIELSDPEPWSEPVAGPALLARLSSLVERYVVLPAGAAEIVALWVAHTYRMELWDHTGYLAIVSPTRRCGKTTLLRILAELALRALSADAVSPAALYRVIDQCAPTLVIDELDRVPRDSDLWPVLHSGHTRGGCVIRCVGDVAAPRQFSTWAPKVLAYIRGSRSPVPDTVEDRCIRVSLQRRARGEQRERLRSRTLASEAEPLRRQLMRWTGDHAEALRDARPPIPNELDDRAADGWEPLLAVADEAGGLWPDVARELAVRFSSERSEEEREQPGVLLLADLAELLETRELGPDEYGLSAESMVKALCGLAERPWCTWGRQNRGLSTTALARLLKPFGVRPAVVGPRYVRVSRYAAEEVRAAAERMAPPPEGETVAQTLSPSHQGASESVNGSWDKGERVRGSEPPTGGSSPKLF